MLCAFCYKEKPSKLFFYANKRGDGKCLDCQKITRNKGRARRVEGKEKELKIQRAQRYKDNRDRELLIQKRWREKNRRIVLEYYSKGRPFCACCGEDIYDFLTIDHLHNNGVQERKQSNGGGHHNYRFIIKSGFPDEYQVLCYNCNCARGKRNLNFTCPHKMRDYHKFENDSE